MPMSWLDRSDEAIQSRYCLSMDCLASLAAMTGLAVDMFIERTARPTLELRGCNALADCRNGHAADYMEAY
jgi:hypothetical protein